MIVKVLFVCTGNICRSPMAEGIFNQLLRDNGLEAKVMVDSAGTHHYHVGELADYRARGVCNWYGIYLTHKARQVAEEDFNEFNYILVMDHLNYEAISNLIFNKDLINQKVMLFRSFSNQVSDDYDVPDPYYGSEEDFNEVYSILKEASAGFLRFLNLIPTN